MLHIVSDRYLPGLSMTMRRAWKKVAFLSCFLIVVGAVEFLIVLQLHDSLHIGEEDGRLARQIITSHHEVELERVQKQWHIERRQSQTKQEQGEQEGEREEDGVGTDEVRWPRELHNLRVDRLNNFRQRTGSLLADQQLRNFELRKYGLPVVPDAVRQQGIKSVDDKEFTLKTPLQRKWNFSLVGEDSLYKVDVLQPVPVFFSDIEGNRLREELRKIHTAEGEGWKNLYNLEQDHNEEEDNEEEEEEDDSDEDKNEHRRAFDPDDFETYMGEDGKVKVRRKQEVLVENMTPPMRDRTLFEREGWNIMLTVRTTVASHRKRLPLLFDTWITKVNSSQVFLITDGPDPSTRLWTSVKGVHYVDAKCGSVREQLCCKHGVELQLMFQAQNEGFDWLCHVDDDMYVNMKNLVELLSVFYPRKDPVYLGRSGSPWSKPRRVKSASKLSQPGKKYHFAVGGMYCLSRAMLDKTKKWLVGGAAFSESCLLTREPDDVTIGFIVALLNYTLSRTEKIYTHGLHLATTVDPYTLKDQVAISYGYGSVQWGEDPYNAVFIQNALFTLEEDESQFRSVHCLLYPDTSWCVQQREIVQLRRDQYGSNYSDNYID